VLTVDDCRTSLSSVVFRFWLSLSVVFRLKVRFSIGGAQLCVLDIKYHLIEYKYLIFLNSEHPQFLRTKIAGGGGRREGYTKRRCLKKWACKGTLRQVFYLSEAPSPPMTLIHRGGGKS
jgi:hypothetical protein